jgi:hypothetical protein
MSHHTFPWHDAFLAALRDMPVVQHACDAVGIQRSTAYRARQANEEFAKAWDDAMEAGVDRAEREAFRRGVVGFEEPVVHQGNLTPIYERDELGLVVMVERRRMVAGTEVVDHVPKQAKDAEGRPMWLTVRKHSDAMLGLVLKARRKAYSTERTELTSPDGSMSPVDETNRAARAAQLIAVAQARKEAEGATGFEDLA